VRPDAAHEVDARGSTLPIGFINAQSDVGAALSEHINGGIACVPAREGPLAFNTTSSICLRHHLSATRRKRSGCALAESIDSQFVQDRQDSSRVESCACLLSAL
jgi:hypothetical protein